MSAPFERSILALKEILTAPAATILAAAITDSDDDDDDVEEEEEEEKEEEEEVYDDHDTGTQRKNWKKNVFHANDLSKRISPHFPLLSAELRIC